MDLQVWLELFVVLGCGYAGIAALTVGTMLADKDSEDGWEELIEED